MPPVSLADIQNEFLRSPVLRNKPVAPLSPEVRPRPLFARLMFPGGVAMDLPIDSVSLTDAGMFLAVTVPPPPPPPEPEPPPTPEYGDPVGAVPWTQGAEREVVTAGFDYPFNHAATSRKTERIPNQGEQ